MRGDITFYFDFSSPYAYLAAQEIEALAARRARRVLWRPILLGALFKTTGSAPLATYPVKWDYALRDLERSARRLGVPFCLPDPFPFAAVAASRAFYALEKIDQTAARGLAQGLYARAFGEGRAPVEPETVLGVAEALGQDRDWLRTEMMSDRIKDRLRRETADALEAGVFGAPFFLVDQEPFWGHDRMAELEDWLESGGW